MEPSKNRERMKEQRKKEFLTFLKECLPIELGKNVDLEKVYKAFDEDPEVFQRNWLLPLLEEGLKLDRVCELVVESFFRPN